MSNILHKTMYNVKLGFVTNTSKQIKINPSLQMDHF